MISEDMVLLFLSFNLLGQLIFRMLSGGFERVFYATPPLDPERPASGAYQDAACLLRKLADDFNSTMDSRSADTGIIIAGPIPQQGSRMQESDTHAIGSSIGDQDGRP